MPSEFGHYRESELPEGTVPFNDIFKLKVIPQGSTSGKFGNISLPDSHYENIQLVKAEIIDIGSNALDLDLSVGDIVLYDRYAAFYRPSVAVGTEILIDFVNIICKVDDNGIYPFGENIMIEALDFEESVKKIGKIELGGKVSKYQDYIVTHIGIPELAPISVGEKVIAYSSGSVSITYESRKCKIIPYECVVGRKIENK